jgi:hypothetical protein
MKTESGMRLGKRLEAGDKKEAGWENGLGGRDGEFALVGVVDGVGDGSKDRDDVGDGERSA